MESPQTNGACAGERTSCASAGQSTERSDAKSERGEKDRIGWRLRLGSRSARDGHGVGHQDGWNDQDLNHRWKRRGEDLRRLHHLARIGRVLVTQRWLRLVYLLAGHA